VVYHLEDGDEDDDENDLTASPYQISHSDEPVIKFM
jgi:hypothetical protein